MNKLCKIALLFLLLGAYQEVSAWGMTGHRIVAELADRHLNKKAKKNIKKLIGNQKLAYWANWPDFIKSDKDPELGKMGSSHFINTDSNLKLDQFHEALHQSSEKNLFKAYLKLKEEAKGNTLTLTQKQQHLYFIIHLIGDAHQPMHVSREADLGGNKIEVTFFGEKTNIHRVWDSDLVENEKYSYTEYATVLDIYNGKYYKKYTETSFEQWLYESHQLANEIYADIENNANLSYSYIYKNKYKMEECLLKAGLRLAKELNEIYGS